MLSLAFHRSAPNEAQLRGFTIVELMVAMTISLMILVALVSIFVNTSRSQNEMVKTSGLIDSGRVSIQILQNDIVHAGYWGGYLPGFDDLTATSAPGDVPNAAPNPCQPYATWDSNYRSNLLGITVQTSDVLPAGAGCLSPLAQIAGTDVLIVRHADTCVPGAGNCEANAPDELYFQPSFCAAEKNAGTVQIATNTTITLASSAAAANGFYNGVTIRLASGVGAGQYRSIRAYNGVTRTATLSTALDVIPDATTTYAFEYALGTTSFPLHRRDCAGTGTPATLPLTGGALADKRRLVSNIYYVTNIEHPERANELIPTLVRSRLAVVDGNIVQQAPEALIEGIEGFRAELGIDDAGDSGAAVDYTTAINWADAAKTSPTNRGDGAPDKFVRCTGAAPCTVSDYTNVVAVKLYVLTRTRDPANEHKDTKAYCLGEPGADGTCPAASTIAAANDSYKRHVFITSVRLTNVSGRRETP